MTIKILRFQPVLFVFVFLSGLTAQNTPPVVSNISVEVDTMNKTVTFSYDLADPEETDAEIWLRVSADSGQTYLVPIDGLSGDIGLNVAVGTNKQILWNYSQSDLSNYLQGTSFTAQIVADDGFELDIQALVNQVDSNRLKNDLIALEGIRHATGDPNHYEDSKNYIKNTIAAQNLPMTIHTFNHPLTTGENIVGRQRGYDEEAAVYIVDGHYDSVENSPGADDNASAVAGVLEIMRILSDYTFGKTIKYIGFDLEEEGLVGSAAYVGTGIPDYEEVEGVFNLEMIGYYSEEPNSQELPFGFDLLFPEVADSLEADSFRGNFITNVSDLNSEPLANIFTATANLYVPELKVITVVTPNPVITPDLLRSDHASFWFDEKRALMLTDGSEFRNNNYHLPSDTIGTLNFTFMTNVVKATLAALAESADLRHIGAADSDFFNLPDLPISSVSNLDRGPRATIEQVFPNPMSHTTNLVFTLSEPAHTTVQVFDRSGSMVTSLFQGLLQQGQHQLAWKKASELPNGLYLFHLTTQSKGGLEYRTSRKVLVMDPHEH